MPGLDYKYCPKCNQKKELSKFSPRKDGNIGYASYCKQCRNSIAKKNFHDPTKDFRQKVYAKTKAYKDKVKTKLLEYLKDKSCKDCGNTDSRVFEFDHLGDKKYDIATMKYKFSWLATLKEIEKCDIVCANCHRIRTFTRSNCYRAKSTEEQ
jgi:hypothetical protein